MAETFTLYCGNDENMNPAVKDLLKSLAPPLSMRAYSLVRLVSYQMSNRRPWRTGYWEYRCQYLSKVVNDGPILDTFGQSDPLPAGYGFRLDARVVEIPWVLSRLTRRSARLLDAGSSLNYEFVLKSAPLTDKKITIVTLAPEAECQWKLGVSYVFGDLRDLGFRDGYFDMIACISTIEHVGMDNTMYLSTPDKTNRGDTKGFLLAVREMKRVLKPGGVLYITFPFGKYENHGWFQQFDSQLMDRLIEGFSPTSSNETIFRYDPDGWRLSDCASCADCQFFDVRTSRYFDRNSKIEYPADYPAGERAVACLELLK